MCIRDRSITVDAQGRITAASGNTVNTDLVGDTSPQLGGNLDVNTKNILFGDSGSASDDRLVFGAGTDMSLYHDGSNSVIENATGDLYIQNEAGNTSNQIYIRGKESTNSIVVHGNGAVELYDQSSGSASKKLNTNSGGVDITGHAYFPDNNGTHFGAGEDLKIWHDGTNSNITNSTGNIKIGCSNNIEINTFDGHAAAKFINDGAVELYYNNSKKLTTTSDGVDFGTAGADHTLAVSGQTVHRMGSQGSGIHFSSNVIVPTNSSGTVVNNTVDLGNSSYRWKNIYTNDLNLSNEGSSNDVDGTWGDWTIQEGESDLFLKNNRSGKKYKFNLTEVS